jgi:hypothetical protein
MITLHHGKMVNHGTRKSNTPTLPKHLSNLS